MLTDGQDTIKCLQKTLLTRLATDHKLYQMLQNAPNAKQTLTDGQDTNNHLQKMLLTRLAPDHKLYQMLQNAPNAKQTLTDSQNTNNCLQNATDQTSSYSLTTLHCI